MSKIILADVDEQYLHPLEIKFAQELGDSVDLEVITDASFFQEFIARPQNADVLVISEELYCREIQRQNFKYIFILTEYMDSSDIHVLEGKKLYKYSSIPEIYNQVRSVIGYSGKQIEVEKHTKVVLTYSPIGGSGKTTIAMGLASYLTSAGNKVLYIDAEMLHTFQFYLKNQNPIPNDFYTAVGMGVNNLYQRIRHCIRTEEFDYLPPFDTALLSRQIDFSVYINLIKSIKEEKVYDVIVVDTDNEYNLKKTELMNLADKILVIFKQTEAAVYAVNMIVKNMNCSEGEKYHFICNDFRQTQFNSISSGNIIPEFVINEYIMHVDRLMESEERNKKLYTEIQKLAFLIN